MLISTRGRYALRVLLDLAEHQDDGYIAMKNVAERQGLSLKYIEKIMPVLSKNYIVEGVHGKGGGGGQEFHSFGKFHGCRSCWR